MQSGETPGGRSSSKVVAGGGSAGFDLTVATAQLSAVDKPLLRDPAVLKAQHALWTCQLGDEDSRAQDIERCGSTQQQQQVQKKSPGDPIVGGARRPFTGGHNRPRSATRSSTGSLHSGSEDGARADATPPKTPPHPHHAPAPAPLQPARPLLLARSRLPPAGTGAAACRRPNSLGPSPVIQSRISASAAAGAIASGRPLTKWPPPPVAPGATPSANTKADVIASPESKAKGAPDRDKCDKLAMEAMATRCSELEKLNRLQAAKLARQSQELDVVRAELGILRKIADAAEELGDSVSPSPDGQDARTKRDHELEIVRAERDRFQRQVEEMTKFLQDYGLSWVGGEADDASEDGEGDGFSDQEADNAHSETPATECPSPAKSVKSTKSTSRSVCSPVRATSSSASSPASPKSTSILQVDVQAMHSHVEALNAVVEKSGARIVSDRVGGGVRARLVTDDALPLPLIFFRDGVKLGGCDFQMFDSKDAQMLIRDIIDGFFPYALKETYPDGVAMKVMDRTAFDFEDWLQNKVQADEELTDGGNRLLPAGGRVLHSGKTVAGAASNHGSVPLAAGASAPPEEISLVPDGSEASAPVSRIQVRLEGGRRLVFTIAAAQTIGVLASAVEGWLAREGVAEGAQNGSHLVDETFQVSLRSAFPPKTYNNLAQTLSDAGLTPSATLFASALAPRASP